MTRTNAIPNRDTFAQVSWRSRAVKATNRVPVDNAGLSDLRDRALGNPNPTADIDGGDPSVILQCGSTPRPGTA